MDKNTNDTIESFDTIDENKEMVIDPSIYKSTNENVNKVYDEIRGEDTVKYINESEYKLNGDGKVDLFGVQPKDQTKKMCIQAVLGNPHQLQFVHKQSMDVCMLAIKLNPLALKHVRTQSYELCVCAVDIHPGAIIYVHNQKHYDRCVKYLKTVGKFDSISNLLPNK